MGNTFKSERTIEFNRLCDNIKRLHTIIYQNFSCISTSGNSVEALNLMNSACFSYWKNIVMKTRQDYIDILGEVNDINNNYNKLLPFTDDEYVSMLTIQNQFNDIKKIMNATSSFLTTNIEAINNSNWIKYESRLGFHPIESI